MSDTYGAGHNCPETLPHDGQLKDLFAPPRARCQVLGPIVVARQVQKEEAWLCSVSLNSRDVPAVPVGVLLGVAGWNCTMMSGTLASITSRASVSWWIPLMA